MTISQILFTIGLIGIGMVIGFVAKQIIDYKILKNKNLFDTRKKAYAEVTARIFNHFLEVDVTSLRKEELIQTKINTLLSEATVLGSNQLVDLLGDYTVKVIEFHKALSKKEEDKSKKLHGELVVLSEQVFKQMRKDLEV